jgi:hypothetical protein
MLNYGCHPLPIDEDQCEPMPIYTIYDRDIPIKHLRAGCIITNPVIPATSVRDGREAHEKSVPGCEGGICLLGEKRN